MTDGTSDPLITHTLELRGAGAVLEETEADEVRLLDEVDKSLDLRRDLVAFVSIEMMSSDHLADRRGEVESFADEMTEGGVVKAADADFSRDEITGVFDLSLVDLGHVLRVVFKDEESANVVEEAGEVGIIRANGEFGVQSREAS